MSKPRPALQKKCRNCSVAGKVGGCLFGCTAKERLTRELEIRIQGAAPRIDPILEQLQKCPEAFHAGKTVERLFQLSRGQDQEDGSRLVPPLATVVSPFV